MKKLFAFLLSLVLFSSCGGKSLEDNSDGGSFFSFPKKEVYFLENTDCGDFRHGMTKKEVLDLVFGAEKGVFRIYHHGFDAGMNGFPINAEQCKKYDSINSSFATCGVFYKKELSYDYLFYYYQPETSMWFLRKDASVVFHFDEDDALDLIILDKHGWKIDIFPEDDYLVKDYVVEYSDIEETIKSVEKVAHNHETPMHYEDASLCY